MKTIKKWYYIAFAILFNQVLQAQSNSNNQFVEQTTEATESILSMVMGIAVKWVFPLIGIGWMIAGINAAKQEKKDGKKGTDRDMLYSVLVGIFIACIPFLLHKYFWGMISNDEVRSSMSGE